MLAGMIQSLMFPNSFHLLYQRTLSKIIQFLVGLPQISKASLLKEKMQIIENK